MGTARIVGAELINIADYDLPAATISNCIGSFFAQPQQQEPMRLDSEQVHSCLGFLALTSSEYN